MKTPKLTLVGAGPGDPDLITLKGVKALWDADVVLYDALVNPELLQHAPYAEHIPVGKRAGQVSVSQKTIHHLIVDHALDNKHVVRLKGGDPFLFARGFEELEYARQYGIETASVVGVSSLHLPGMYGIPLTVRGINQSFSVVTATTSEGTLSEEVRLAAFNSPMTLFFMGLGKLELIVDLYKNAGRSDLPLAIISRGSMEGGFIFQSTVGEVIKEIMDVDIPAPALLLFGEGAGVGAQQMVTPTEGQITEVA
ncbi:MAG: uroporphyrinogen-III C-methyltransferase [Bacteroidota bacterium]